MLLTGVNVQNMTVGEYLEIWLAGKHALKPKTVSLYRSAIDLYLAPHLGEIALLELRAHHLDRFYAAIAIGIRGRPLSSSSIRRIHAPLRSALNTAVKRRLIPYNPALHVELAPEPLTGQSRGLQSSVSCSSARARRTGSQRCTT